MKNVVVSANFLDYDLGFDLRDILKVTNSGEINRSKNTTEVSIDPSHNLTPVQTTYLTFFSSKPFSNANSKDLSRLE
jgi:hypothetical protein